MISRILPAMTPYRTLKTFDNYPCSHRQWRHQGHCKFIHGYSRSFTLVFGCESLDDLGFGVDFGDFGELKDWFDHWFDHTLLINEDDPERSLFEDLHARQIVDLRVLPNVSMECTAAFVFSFVDPWIRDRTDNRVVLLEVECRENNKNAGRYLAPTRV